MAETNYLDQLNSAQRAAVEYLDGPQLVIAGAGSGKTRVLTYKIVHLLANGYNTGSILALTFTNKAAREMRERICTLVGEERAARLWMGTFHSIFARILRANADRIGYTSNFTIYDTADSRNLIKTIIKELGLDDKYYRPGAVMADISQAKNNLYSPEDYAADTELMRAAADCRRGRTAEIYAIYRDRCRIAGALDFDDLLYYTNILLRDNPDILENYRRRFRYVLVDEYQDTNFAQHVIVRQLCGEGTGLTVVGDDAQSIYSFRGANIRNILDLRKSFPALRTFKLEQNYRSTKNIIGAANSLIACNKEQIPKEVFTDKAKGERIEVVQCFNEYEEGYTIANAIGRRRMRVHINFSDFAILYRTNAQSRTLEEALRNRNIPYRIYGGLAFYQRKEVKDAVCYFRLAVNPDDDEALKRVINTPRRGIGDTTVNKLVAASISTGRSIFNILSDPLMGGIGFNKGTAAKLRAFADMIGGFISRNENGTPAGKIASHIIEQTGLLAQYAVGSAPENVSKRENIVELLKAVDEKSQEALEQEGRDIYTMAEFLAEVSLLTDMDTSGGSDDCVTLMTIHSAKGLEFDSVIIAGVEEELLPSAMSLNSPNAAREVEEERRLMYVAITRAMRYCMITFARKRMTNGQTVSPRPSRFLSEIDRRYMRLTTGTSLVDAPSARPSRSQFTIRSTERPDVAIPSPRAPFGAPRPPAPVAPTAQSTAADGEYRRFEVNELTEGMAVEHPRFGRGTVITIDTAGTDPRIVVEFDTNGTRTLLLKFAKIKAL